jgi:hypothetical protein
LNADNAFNHFAKMKKQPSTFTALILVSITALSQKNEKKIIDTPRLQKKQELCIITSVNCQKTIYSLVISMLPNMAMAGKERIIALI